MSFIIVDTEGTDFLREIAILSDQGKLLYEAFTQEHPSNASVKFRGVPLQKILQQFSELAQKRRVVCHSAEHDRRILKASFRHAGVTWENVEFECTRQLSQQIFPGLLSYSLEYLSKLLILRVRGNHFNSRAAHSARYDAEFTYQLYLKIMDAQTKQLLQSQPNPFSSRVDTPFQKHPDCQQIYQSEFSLLKSVIEEIRKDHNHQSRGTVVIGEPGCGKTHLMMRLAQELLQINRLLFIRQPNNPDAVLHHIYARVLESFVQHVPANGYTQLENLLAHSFVKIISKTQHLRLTQKDQYICSIIQENPLNLYRKLGSEETAIRRDYWQHIEKRVSAWWMDQYGIAGFGSQIIRGIIKFCSYSDPKLKVLVSKWLAAQQLETDETERIDLPNWGEEISREEFSLEAISVFSRLSLLDEPLIIIFDQLEGLKYNEQLLRQFGFAITELFTHVPNSLIILNLFPDRWQDFQTFFDGAFIDRISQYQITLNRPSNEQILEILNIKLASINTDLKTVFNSEQLNDILSYSSIRAILNRAATHYRYFISGDPVPSTVNTLSQPKITEITSDNIASLHQRLQRLEQSFFRINQVFDAIANVVTSSTDFQEIPKVEKAEINSSFQDSENDSFARWKLDEQSEIKEYLHTQQKVLETRYSQPQIITDNDDIGKLLTISQAFQKISDFNIDQLRLGRRVLPDHLVIEWNTRKLAIGFLGVSGTAFTSRISNYNELVLNYSNIQFYLFRDTRHGEINGKIAKQQIASLNNAPNGKFEWIDQHNRIIFDLIYYLVSDIQNKEVDFSLSTSLEVLTSNYSDYWLTQILS